jgi:hypothetical protein
MADVNPFGDEAVDVNPFGDEPVEEQQTSGELDLAKIQQRRNSGESDEAIFNDIVNQAGTAFNMDGKPFDLAPAIKDGVPPTALLDFIMSGKTIDTSIDSGVKAGIKSVGTAGTNLLGLPVDLVNMGLQSGESLFRQGVNKLASINAPEGVDDPNSPNYDPNFYLSTDPEDFLLSSTNPIGGGQNVRDVGNTVLGENTYVTRENVPEEYRAQFGVGRVVTENLIPAFAILKTAKAGIGLTNPLIKEAAQNPTRFRNVEGAATAGAAGLTAFIEKAGLGDNPWAQMGAEFLGALVGGNVASATSRVGGVADATSKTLEDLVAGFSDGAARKGAVNDILLAAQEQRKILLDQAKAATDAGDTALADRLTEVADAHTPERIIQDLETSLALGDASPVDGVNLPAGTLTDNPTLVAIQNGLISGSSDKGINFPAAVAEEVNTALSQILATSERLARAGNQFAADTLRERYFQNILNTRIKLAQDEANARLTSLSPDMRQTEASKIAQQTLFEARENIIEMEDYLYGRIDDGLQVDASKVAERIAEMRSTRLLDGETIAGGGQLDAAINNIAAKAREGTLSVAEVRRFRSRMLDAAREAAAKFEFTRAGIFDELANASVDSLNTIPYELGGEAVETARKFSNLKHERFTRYFNMDALSTVGTGGTAMRPEQVLENALAGTPINRAQNLSEMRGATEFSDTMGPRVNDLKERELQEEFNKFARGIGVEPNSITMPAEITGPSTTLPSTKTTPDLQRMRPSDRPAEGELSQAQQAAELLFRFANKMEADGRMDLAEEARRRAQAFYKYRGPRGEEYFDPPAPKPEETVEDFKLNEGGESTSVSVEGAFVDTPVELAPRMSNAQEQFLRGAATRLRKSDGTINTAELENFMSARENADVLEGFPNFRAELVSLLDAQRTADEIFRQFSAIAETGALPDAIGKVLNSNQPVDDYVRLANEAMGDQNALRDLRMATIDTLFEGARDGAGNPDFFKLTAELTKPLSGRADDLSILEIMEQQGVIGSEDISNIGQLIQEGLRIQRSTMTPAQFNEVVKPASDIVSNTARIFGANFGAMFGMGEGSQLQAAAIGSAAFKKLVAGLPGTNKLEQMKILMLQPRVLKGAIQDNPNIRRGALDSIKEFMIKYGSEFKGLSKKQMAGKVAKDVTVGAATATGRGIVNRASEAPIATSSALSEATQQEERPTVSVDDQMMNLFPQSVDVPTLSPITSEVLDE